MQQLIANLLKHKYKILAIGYTAWLTFISLISLDGYSLPSFKLADKLVHFFLYFLLALIWLLAYPKFWQRKFIFVLIVIFWGVIIEFLQEFVAIHRSGDPFDALANTVGGLTGLVVYHYLFNNTKTAS